MLGKIEGKRREGWKRMRQSDSITDSTDMNLGKFQETVGDRDAWHAGRKKQSHRSMGNPPAPKERTSLLGKRRTLEKPMSLWSQRVEHDLVNEQQQQPIFKRERKEQLLQTVLEWTLFFFQTHQFAVI